MQNKVMDKILEQINRNKLHNLSYAFLIAQLCVLNNKSFEEIQKIVDKLITKKLIRINTKDNTVVNSKKINSEYKVETESNIDIANKILKIDPKKVNKRGKKQRIQCKIDGTKKGYAFGVALNNEVEDVFIPARDLKGAVNNDIVIVEVLNPESKKPEGKVVQILERGNERIVGTIQLYKNNAFVLPDDVKFGKDIFVPLNKTLKANNGDKVVVEIKNYSNKKYPEGVVTEVLGEPNKIGTEVKGIIRSYNLFEDFPKKVKLEAEKVPQVISYTDFPNRRNLTNLLCFTIDGEDSRDLDDAVSIEKTKDGLYNLGVHIADVGEYVKMGSVIDKEAFKRGTSVYFPNLVLPMLPRELSNGICSLNENIERLALSVQMHIDNKGDVKKYDIFESVIKSKKRFTYTEVQGIIDKNKYYLDENKPFIESINLMVELSDILIKKRDKRGAIDFNIPETEIVLDDLGDVIDISKKDRKESHRLIESFMIAANECVAEHFKKLKVPFVYRVHEEPDSEKMNNFLRIASGFGVGVNVKTDNVQAKDLQEILKQVETMDCNYSLNKICLRSMKKAKYDTNCLGHYGIASKFYCHFTSPIRRYPDLTIHRIIKDYLNGELVGKNLTNTKNFVTAAALRSSDREVIADKVERDVDDLYKVFYMTHHVGEDFVGRISSVTNFGIFVELDNTVEGMVRIEDLPKDYYEFNENDFVLKGAHNSYSIGQTVNVRCINANIAEKQVDFVLI